MTGYKLEQRDDANRQPNEAIQDPGYSPESAAAITIVPRPLSPPPAPQRSWWRIAAISAGTGVLGGLVWLLWWTVLRSPAKPHILDFLPAASQYSVVQQQPVGLNWQVSNPQQVDKLLLRAYDLDGALVGETQTYDLSEALPVALLPHCQQTDQLLTCKDVPTEIRQPGQYRFELTLLPRASLDLPPVTATSSLVKVQALPQPAVVELAPNQVIYSESGTQPNGNPQIAPPVNEAGVRLSWIVKDPGTLQDLLLVVKQEDGTVLGGRRYTFRKADDPGVIIPEPLKPFCQLKESLICQGVPTGITEVGRYRFELTPIPVGFKDQQMPEPKVTETVQIQPRPVRIVSFTINGQNAQPKYLIPVDQGQPLPGFRLGWKVDGGSTTRVELLPSPGSVGLQGVLPLPLSPSGSTTITLKVSDGEHPPLIRAVTIDTFDPTPNPPQPAPATPPARQSTSGNTDSGNPNPSNESESSLSADEIQRRIQSAQPTPESSPNPTSPADSQPSSPNPSDLGF